MDKIDILGYNISNGLKNVLNDLIQERREGHAVSGGI